MPEKPIVAVTMGDAAGIGPEIIAKAFAKSNIKKICRPIVIGDSEAVRQGIKIAGVGPMDVNPIKDVKEAKYNPNFIDVLDLDNIDLSKVKSGQINVEAGRASVEYVLKAIDLAMKKKIDAITTAPINKFAMYKAGYNYEGHTEILADKTKTKDYAMIFLSDSLWLALVTTHIALKHVPKHVTKEKILSTIKIVDSLVKTLRLKKAKIAVAGLNPHAGENGLFGKEEIREIKPAIEEAKKLGIKVEGPISPDAVFYLANAGMYDVVVAMYHDQGLIPFKLLSFNKSVNVTVGLPIVRTSVDHGTGYDIVGKGWANPGSLIEAIKVATLLAERK